MTVLAASKITELAAIFTLAAETLPAAGITCLLIGGFAVNHYGYTRNTLDVDLMIVSERRDDVRQVMIREGFTNASVHENVMFFQRPGSRWRVDFLSVDEDTMAQLVSRAEQVFTCGKTIRVPALKDLIAMKLFSLAQNVERRMGKDLPDIAHLAIFNSLDLDRDIHPLAVRYASEDVFKLVANQIKALQP